MNKSRNLIIIIILLVLAIGGISFFAFRQVQENKEMSELFAIEKEEMENEYTTFANQYDELQIQINNDSLRLLEELRQVKSSNAAEITRLKKELKTVREVMRSYIVQIDSLNRLNEALVTENKAVKEKYTEATRQITSLAEEKKTLNEKVALAAQLDATNISVQAKNKRGKTIEKAKNVKKIAVSFTIVKNITAQTGERIIYIRIAQPGNEILSKSASDTFTYENRELQYSIKKYIEYTGEEQELTAYWDVEEFLQAGTYNVYIFADGTMIGESSFKLK